jgi:2-methylisocitrate lyase-like PEP mutase family enzyme
MRKTLRSTLEQGDFVVAPGVFDMISARMADRMGFHALYMTGYGVSASHLGLPDAGLVGYTDMVSRARTMCEGTRTPLVADADTGFGGLINIRQTVRGYEAAGVQAIQLEDQEMPKKCGHTPNRRVVPMADMVRRLDVALDARASPDFLVIARTDARTGLGIDEALRRGRAYAEAGADMVFVEAPEGEEEFKRIGGELGDRTWLVANMVPRGARSPEIPASTLKAWGFAMAIYPGAGMAVMCAALEGVYRHLEAHGGTAGCDLPAWSIHQMHEFVGFPDVWAFEKRFAETGEAGAG